MSTGSAKKTLRNNTIALMIIRILNYALPFITLPYVSRIFTVEKFGLIFYAQILMDYFFRVVMFGFDFSGVRTIAINSDDTQKVNKSFSEIFFVQILFLIIAYILLCLITIFIPKFHQDWIIYHITFLTIVGQVLLFTWFYQGMEKMKFITILNIITRSIFVILIFSCIKKADDYILYPTFNAISCLTTAGIGAFFMKKYFNIKLQIPSWNDIVETIKYSSEFFITKVAIALYRQTNAFVLGIMCTTTAVAYYVAADKMYWGLLSLYFTFINALFPYMSKNKDIAFFKKMIKYLIILAVGTSLFLCLTSKLIILSFFSAKYTEAVHILQIFSLSFAAYVFVDTLGFPLLGAFGYVKETNWGYIIGGIYNLIGLLLLYTFNNINITSVAILVSSTYFIMFLHRIHYVRKYKLLSSAQEVK